MRTRRRLSTVVGAVFAIIAITSTVAYVTYSMNIINNFGQSAFAKSLGLGLTASSKTVRLAM